METTHVWLIVGLGNPGLKYSLHRHNIGFLALDAYCASIGNPPWKEDHDAFVTRFKIEGPGGGEPVEVLFAKPATYMNKSGEPTRALMDYYKIPIENLIVVHDEIDQGFGAIKIHKNRGPGGHNGIKSLNEQLGTQDYTRLKLGVGRPADPRMDVAAYVLQNFSKDEQPHMHEFLAIAGDAIEGLIFDGYGKAASKYTRAAISATTDGASGD